MFRVYCDNVVMSIHVRHIVTIWLCSSHCDNMVMANLVHQIATICFLHHIVIMWLSPFMLVRL
jgi:hypothetical protein